MSNIHQGHRARVKEEFRKNGLSHFQDHRILEMLLYYSVPRSDTNEMGHLLMERFGSLSGVFDSSIELLTETKGLGTESATLIKFVSELIRAYMDDYTDVHNVITDPASAKEYMRYKFLCRPAECIYLTCMGANGKVIFSDQIAEGSPESVHIRPADVVKAALKANAVTAVLAHNHPNGICTPSSRDLSATSVLARELLRVDVELIDHIIIAPDGIYSMKEKGMLPVPGKSDIIY